MLAEHPLLWLAGFLVVTLCSSLGVAAVRRFTRRHQILDVPNQRSSHTVPTPRGGGVVIVIGTVAAWAVLACSSDVAGQAIWLVIGAVAIAAVGLLEDVTGRVSVARRATMQLAAAGLALLALTTKGEAALPLIGPIPITAYLMPVMLLCIVGMTNVYNFMDGIDGIAAGQAIVAGVGWAILGQLAGSIELLVTGWIVAATSLGFLTLNWHPAKIFMGDVGSTFLGYVFACLCFGSIAVDSRLPFCGALLIWPFLFDGLLCLVRRTIRGEPIWKPHRSHLYQRLVIAGCSHWAVSLLYIGLSLLGLVLSLVYLTAKANVDLVIVAVVAIAAASLWTLVVVREKRSKSILAS
jgi:UDP-N-acetylmuramyl pentapeptide phosphotransferase/UDP-N-acetylglucosamine-1-phosphate transferase